MSIIETVGRRALLRGGLRYAALAGIAALAMGLWKKHKEHAATTCSYEGLCGRCQQLNNCRLPLAVQHKKQTTVSSS